MKHIILVALCLMCLVGSASAYTFSLSCPESVQVGLPLKCSVDTNLPAGTTFDVVMYQSGYTATPLQRKTVTVQDNHATQYQLIDTKGFPGGQYKVEIQFTGADEGRLSTGSVTLQLPILIDRTSEITITSPLSQSTGTPLRIEGSVIKLGNDGVEIEVRGPDGLVFGPQWIGTKLHIQDGSGEFTQQVAVPGPGAYDVTFSDAKSFIGIKTFNVVSPATSVPTTVPTTVVLTSRTLTTIATPLPTTTQSPLSPLTMVAALSLAGLLLVFLQGKKQ
jgi:hypothetical protein